MPDCSTFTDYAARLREFISRHSQEPGRAALPRSRVSVETAQQPHPASEGFRHTQPVDEFNELAWALFSMQFEHVPTYRRFCEARGATLKSVASWKEIPAIPTAAFKGFDLTSLLPAERAAVFHSSGTTTHQPGRHFHNRESIEVYEASLRPWFRRHVLPELELGKMAFRFIILTPPPDLAPHSSLAHMFDTARREFAEDQFLFAGRTEAGWCLDKAEVWTSLSAAARDEEPVVVLGTAFTFLELLNWMNENRLRISLPSGSRALETGGYKGRTRALPKAELYGLIADRLGIPSTHIVGEYGMCELSSQAYDLVVGAPRSQISNFEFEIHRRFHFPPWARVQIVSPETGSEVREGETGLIRICDLANVRSVLAVQTEDLGIRRGEGFELVGRATFAEPRGCSLMSVGAL
jgi:hypothetical protein